MDLAETTVLWVHWSDTEHALLNMLVFLLYVIGIKGSELCMVFSFFQGLVGSVNDGQDLLNKTFFAACGWCYGLVVIGCVCHRMIQNCH